MLGAVLVGGSSRRMGVDKATMLVGGVPLGGRSVDALRGVGISEVVLVGASARQSEALGAPALTDDDPGGGPLPAVLTAMRHAESSGLDRVAVLACDLPGITAGSVGELLDAQGEADALIVLAAVGGIGAPPNGVWPTVLLPEVAALVAAGARGFRELDPSWVRLVELGRAAADADVPGDLP